MSERDKPSTEAIAAQFGTQARLYAISEVHRSGATLERLLERMQPVMDEALLDLASGPAHTGLFFAPYVRAVTGYDASTEMLHAARLGAKAKSIAGFTAVCGDAHRLPFADRAFDLVTCRAAAHHFAEPRAALAEAARVLKRGGRLGIVDGMVPEDDELDRFINDLDVLHDPTTVRNYRPSEWRAMVEGTGLRLDLVEDELRELAKGRSLEDWIARAGGTSAVFEEARRRLLGASSRVREYLLVEEKEGDVLFDYTRVLIMARRID
jgi:ubiquinone/menaquinone biosynthesis C-methylase UbiE